MAEGKKKKKRVKLVAKVNKNMANVTFIKDVDGGSIKKGQKAKLSAATAMDFYLHGYVDVDSKEMAKNFPETKRFVEDNEDHVKGLRATNKYD